MPVNEKLSTKDSFIVVVVLYAGVDSLGRPVETEAEVGKK